MATIGLAVLLLTQTQSVTVTSRGGTVSQLLQEVTRQTGIQAAGGNVADNRVIVKVDQMPADRFLRDLAKALGAHWTKGALHRPEPDLSKIGFEAQWKRRMQETLNDLAAKMRPEADWSFEAVRARVERVTQKARQDPESSSTFFEGNPDRILLQEALSKLPAEVFQECFKTRSRITFSTSPNEFQRPLPYRPQTVERFLKARESLRYELRAMPRELKVYAPSFDTLVEFKEIDEVIVTLLSDNGHIYMKLFAVTPEGKVAAKPEIFLTPKASPYVLSPYKGSVKLRPESAVIETALSAGNTHPFLQEQVAYPSFPWVFDPAMRAALEFIRDPVKNEPLSFGATDILFGFADLQKKNLIAYMTEPTAGTLLYEIKGETVSLGAVLTNALNAGMAIDTGETLVIHSAQPQYSEQTDRAALKQAIERMRVKGYFDLEDRIATPAFASLGRRWLKLGGYGFRAAPSMTICEALNLDPHRMPAGVRTFPLANCPQRVRALAKFDPIWLMGFWAGGTTEIQALEQTERISGTRPAVGELKVTTKDSDVVFAIDPAGVGRFLEPGDLRMRLSDLKSGGEGENEIFIYEPRKFDRFRLGRKRTIKFEFVYRAKYLDPKYKELHQAHAVPAGELDDILSLDDKVLTWGEVPASIRLGK